MSDAETPAVAHKALMAHPRHMPGAILPTCGCVVCHEYEYYGICEPCIERMVEPARAEVAQLRAALPMVAQWMRKLGWDDTGIPGMIEDGSWEADARALLSDAPPVKCQCHLEIGDSPCPVHDHLSEDYDTPQAEARDTEPEGGDA